MKAIRHWRTYLKLDPAGHWSDLARNELRKLYQANVHPGAKDRARAAGAE
jgi:hypothetical protein